MLILKSLVKNRILILIIIDIVIRTIIIDVAFRFGIVGVDRVVAFDDSWRFRVDSSLFFCCIAHLLLLLLHFKIIIHPLIWWKSRVWLLISTREHFILFFGYLIFLGIEEHFYFFESCDN